MSITNLSPNTQFVSGQNPSEERSGAQLVESSCLGTHLHPANTPSPRRKCVRSLIRISLPHEPINSPLAILVEID